MCPQPLGTLLLPWHDAGGSRSSRVGAAGEAATALVVPRCAIAGISSVCVCVVNLQAPFRSVAVCQQLWEGAAVCLQQPLLPCVVLCGAGRCCTPSQPLGTAAPRYPWQEGSTAWLVMDVVSIAGSASLCLMGFDGLFFH